MISKYNKWKQVCSKTEEKHPVFKQNGFVADNDDDDDDTHDDNDDDDDDDDDDYGNTTSP